MRSSKCVTSDRGAVHHKRRKRHNNQLLRNSRLNRLKLNVILPARNANSGASSRNNVESTLVRRKLNVRQDLCANSNLRANASQHQLDRHNRNNDA